MQFVCGIDELEGRIDRGGSGRSYGPSWYVLMSRDPFSRVADGRFEFKRSRTKM